jgi:peptide chain release factor subunit 3
MTIARAASLLITNCVFCTTKGEFEAGLAGQTKEHLMLIKTLGVTQLIVLINSESIFFFSKSKTLFIFFRVLNRTNIDRNYAEMDEQSVNWSKARYDECVTWASNYVKTLGFTVGKGSNNHTHFLLVCELFVCCFC